MTLKAIRYQRGKLEILDQLLLPDTSKYIGISDTDAGWRAIKKMQVRGAPAIAIVGCLSLAVEMSEMDFQSLSELKQFVTEKLEYLVSSRPTAVNMFEASVKGKKFVKELAETSDYSPQKAKIKIMEQFEDMLEKDVDDNKKIGHFGAKDILSKNPGQSVKVMTHCNTGSLATAGYGTALGIIRSLHEQNKLSHVYCTETRPYNQGSRLTAYELVYEKMNASLICDSMAAACMKDHKIDAVVVGADRVVSNGDTANKIGTYQLAVVAKHHGVPFYVACPKTTFDPTLETGESIVIEQRPELEMTTIKGIQIAAPGISCWNPAFDVTPAELITGGIVTEYGIFKPGEVKSKLSEYD